MVSQTDSVKIDIWEFIVLLKNMRSSSWNAFQNEQLKVCKQWSALNRHKNKQSAGGKQSSSWGSRNAVSGVKESGLWIAVLDNICLKIHLVLLSHLFYSPALAKKINKIKTHIPSRLFRSYCLLLAQVYILFL